MRDTQWKLHGPDLCRIFRKSGDAGVWNECSDMIPAKPRFCYQLLIISLEERIQNGGKKASQKKDKAVPALYAGKADGGFYDCTAGCGGADWKDYLY